MADVIDFPPERIRPSRELYDPPTEAELSDPVFQAIWETIQHWWIQLPTAITAIPAQGNHAVAILRAMRKAR